MIKKIVYSFIVVFLFISSTDSFADKIRIGTEGAYPPWNATDASGNLTGFEVELAYELCHIMKHDCTIVQQDWDGTIPALLNGKFDAVMSGMSITHERLKTINFSQGYADEVSSFAVSSNQFINTIDSINFSKKLNSKAKKSMSILKNFLSGKTVCVQAGTIHQNFLEYEKSLGGKFRIKTYKSFDEVGLNLSKGNCQVGLHAAVAFMDYSEKTNRNINLIGPTFSGGYFGNGVGVGIRKEDKKLLKQFNKAIKIANKRGITQKLAVKWFGFNASMDGIDYIANLKETPQIENKILEIAKEEKTETPKITTSEDITKSEVKVAEKPKEEFKPDATVVDDIKPIINIKGGKSELTFNDPEFVLKGKVTDQGGSENVYLFIQSENSKRQRVSLKNGNFAIDRFNLDDHEITLIAIDGSNNKFTKKVKIFIDTKEDKEIASQYEKLRPLKIAKQNDNRVAIIIGIEKYQATKVKALYANNDAKLFSYFANKSLGIQQSNMKLLLQEEATRLNTILAIKNWLPKRIIENKTEIFLFFSGHGYPSKEGAYIIPQNGDPRILEESSLSQNYIINQIMRFKPKSVTMFFDACYSGQSNTGEALIAGLKPLKITSDDEGSIPENVNIFSSSGLDQTSSTIKEAEHGIFTYYLLKGLQGNADKDEDKKITNLELFEYLKKNVGNEAMKQNHDQEPMLKTEKPEQVIMKY